MLHYATLYYTILYSILEDACGDGHAFAHTGACLWTHVPYWRRSASDSVSRNRRSDKQGGACGYPTPSKKTRDAFQALTNLFVLCSTVLDNVLPGGIHGNISSTTPRIEISMLTVLVQGAHAPSARSLGRTGGRIVWYSFVCYKYICWRCTDLGSITSCSL